MTLWLVWVLIGIIGGYMVDRLVYDSTHRWLLLVIGIASAAAGGWLMTMFAPESMTPDKVQIYSLLTSVCGCALILWITTLLIPAPVNKDEEDA